MNELEQALKILNEVPEKLSLMRVDINQQSKDIREETLQRKKSVRTAYWTIALILLLGLIVGVVFRINGHNEAVTRCHNNNETRQVVKSTFDKLADGQLISLGTLSYILDKANQPQPNLPPDQQLRNKDFFDASNNRVNAAIDSNRQARDDIDNSLFPTNCSHIGF